MGCLIPFFLLLFFFYFAPRTGDGIVSINVCAASFRYVRELEASYGQRAWRGHIELGVLCVIKANKIFFNMRHSP